MPRSLRCLVCVMLSALSFIGDSGTVSAAEPAAKQTPAQPTTAKPGSPQFKKVISPTNSRNVRAAVKHALNKPIRVDAVKTSLVEFIGSLREQIGIDICLDEQELKEEGLSPDTPITLRVSGLPAKSVLNLALRPLHLGWAIDNGVLLITSERKSFSTSLTVKAYDVADLVVCRNAKGAQWDDYDTLIGVIIETIEPATWSKNGGQASITGATLGTAKVLVVAQSPDAHRSITQLLKSIRRIAAKKSGGDELPRKDKPQARPIEATY